LQFDESASPDKNLELRIFLCTSFIGYLFLGVTLQIASSFLLATSGRAVRYNLYVFKEKTQRIFAAIPHAKHSVDLRAFHYL
jgi:hypothetical protein